jgi:hypothetical protein
MLVYKQARSIDLMKKKKPSYIKDSTIDMSDVKQVVNPELKKRNDETFKVLVDNLNRNTTKKS